MTDTVLLDTSPAGTCSGEHQQWEDNLPGVDLLPSHFMHTVWSKFGPSLSRLCRDSCTSTSFCSLKLCIYGIRAGVTKVMVPPVIDHFHVKPICLLYVSKYKCSRLFSWTRGWRTGNTSPCPTSSTSGCWALCSADTWSSPQTGGHS